MRTESSSSSNSDDRQPKAAEAPASPAPLGLRADLLERVIRETIADSSLETSGDLREKLLEVARRYPQSQLELDPVVIDLVKAVLGPQFARSVEGLTGGDEMATCIAQTLFADAAARERLNSLWTNLSEASRA
jgi:hypothetical protein